MSEASHGDPVRAATALRLALDQLSAACIDGDLDEMLSAEAGLSAALSYLQMPLAAPADPTDLVLEIEALRRALARAERVGASFEEIVHMSIGLLTPAAVYDREGRERAAAYGPALETRG